MSRDTQQPSFNPFEDHLERSQFVRDLILATEPLSRSQTNSPPQILVQYWDDIRAIPVDVQLCLDSWACLDKLGFVRQLFDDISAARFIDEHFSTKHRQAFDSCGHPAMRADYFRLCFMTKIGGVYVDADDVYQGRPLDQIVCGDRLKLQLMCFDLVTESMTNPVVAAIEPLEGNRVFYVNNNPLISPAGHPIIALALEKATSALLAPDRDERDIQGLTGPGNLTACLVAHALQLQESADNPDYELIKEWESFAVSQWPLEYRKDARNWRRWAHGA